MLLLIVVNLSSVKANDNTHIHKNTAIKIDVKKFKLSKNTRYSFKDKIDIAVSNNNIFLLRACKIYITTKEAKVISDIDFCDLDNSFNYRGNILLHKNKLFVSPGTKMLHAIDISNLNILWSKTLASYLRSNMTADSDGNLFFSTTDNKLYAIEQNNGKILWNQYVAKNTLHNLPLSRPIAYKDKVFFNYSPGYITALSKSGDMLWNKQFTVMSSVVGLPFFITQDMLFTFNNNSITELDVEIGEEHWSYKEQPVFAIMVQKNTVFLVQKNKLVALNAENKNVLWENVNLNNAVRDITTLNNYLIIFDSTNSIKVFDVETGELLAKRKKMPASRSTLFIKDDKIYFYSERYNSIYTVTITRHSAL
ncbi:hypothetical protein CAXC1_30004 [Candidatus Xenohaliotis californiensis]|uniref:Pyrrolo-quinoline quinone repeat domain-containing protein n=1 Tax=Candidatus Xenohaliotis californiensis TaxID=84677 RepID=A0ABM9N917_9RICK|nr:hypothetical protein CAXC1_30004 [Candidatus Xenohaliotis californiensis]